MSHDTRIAELRCTLVHPDVISKCVRPFGDLQPATFRARQPRLDGAGGSLAEARSLLERRHFDLAIIDLMLPDGDGSELFDELAQRDPPPPVIIFSALDSPVHDGRLALRQLVKSRHSGSQLAALIQQLLQHWPPSQAPETEEANP